MFFRKKQKARDDMAVTCGNTNVPVGSETCKLCVSHGCEGYKQAAKQNKQRENLHKKHWAEIIETLKETIIGWIFLILISISICITVGVPFLFLHFVGFGEWQIIVCILWLLFWLSFVITVGMRKERNKESEE